MTAADLAKVDALIAVLGRLGFDTAAKQLNEALHETAYASSSEMLGEVALAVRAAGHLVGGSTTKQVNDALREAK